MKTILGLDLGTNSIGWSLIEHDFDLKTGRILGAGSRILPMSLDVLGEFDSGVSISQTAERTRLRGIRRLRERQLLRRERLHRVLNILNFLPKHYSDKIDFEKRLGQFYPETEPKLPYKLNFENGKPDFIFKESFAEMLQDFKDHQPQLLTDGKKVPYDWTIYYLRKKALRQKIEREELAWIILNFNQKRGYYQLRGEEEDENPDKKIEFYVLKVVSVSIDPPQKGKDDRWYSVNLENGWIYRRTSKTDMSPWIGKEKEFIVTTTLNEDKTEKKDKQGNVKRSFKAVDSDKDWIAIKKTTEEKILKSEKYIGEFIYDSLLQNPDQKITGKLVRVIERKFYKAELQQILKTQQGFHSELQDPELYSACLSELYNKNEAHRTSNQHKDFTNLFLNDIIFYQRPLKSKKSLISNCKFESRSYVKNGQRETEPVKCIAKSHPLFQEFRLWQWIQNLRIYKRGVIALTDVTDEFLTSEDDLANLFEWLNDRKEIDQKALLGYKPFKLKKGEVDYCWNNNEDKSFTCNETRAILLSRLKEAGLTKDYLTKENEELLWHILYSVEDKIDSEKALKTFASKNKLGDEFVDSFKKTPPFKKEYGSYSAKAIKKLLPLMRKGKYWKVEEAHNNIELYKENIKKVLLTLNAKNDKKDEEADEGIEVKSNLYHLLENLASADVYSFEGIDHYLASYIVYGRHSEVGEAKNWNTVGKIELIQQHSLRNPIVEQVINETLKVVRDIWKVYGESKESYFNEIHIELGREMKNPADKRKRMSEQISENENTNLRIKLLLAELLNDSEVKDVRPYSPMQQEILKLYEEGALNGEKEELPDYVSEVLKAKLPTSAQLMKYKLWLEQRYKSPYTGNVIPLNKLFTNEYQIEHIIPISRYFDDSFNNKVICETNVNTDKANFTAHEYIKENHGKKIGVGNQNLIATIFSIEQYEEFVKTNYKKNKSKLEKLLMDDIPVSFVQRQLNDSRYISKVVKNLMSNIVREQDEHEVTSKNVITITGAVTSKMKQDWGLNHIWNDIIIPRFQRLNMLTGTNSYGEWTNKNGKKVFQTQVPIDQQKGFNKKRIDHRHHALDAIVIACITREHVNYLSSINSERKNYGLVSRLRVREESNEKDGSKKNVPKAFFKPWGTFTQDTRDILFLIVSSFKQDLRIISKSGNYYQSWANDTDGKLIKQITKQTKGDNWSIRKSMHRDFVRGAVQLKIIKVVTLSAALDNCIDILNKPLKKYLQDLMVEHPEKKIVIDIIRKNDYKWNDLDISKVEIMSWDRDNVAIRVKLDESFNSEKIESITDTGIQKILLKHLTEFDELKNGKIIKHPELAFSADGLDQLNLNLLALNNGKFHKPIYKVRTFEPKGNKFNIGSSGNKMKKFVEADKGTNLFYGIYSDDSGKRNYLTMPLNEVIEFQKQGLPSVPLVNSKGHKLLMTLSPNDLVYVPDLNEEVDIYTFDLNSQNPNKIYKVVSFTANRLYAIPCNVAVPIVNKLEFTQLNKLEFSLEKVSIKEFCIKLKTDRLGNYSLA